MVNVLCIMASPRPNGFTAALMGSVIEGIKSVEGVDYEEVHLYNYHPISPCTSCWSCIRNEEHRCTLDDSMGKMGDGELFKKIEKANALFIAQPVYGWGIPAATHLFLERFYPFAFSQELNGMPFASLSQAGNQGMARLANMRMAKFAFTLQLKFVGGLPVHMVQFEEAKIEARYLGVKTSEASKEDALGRRKITDLQRYLGVDGNPWSVLEPYIDNLTNGTYTYDESLIEYALSHGAVKNEDAVKLLSKAGEELKLTLRYYRLREGEEATKHLLEASRYWTDATDKEYFGDI